MQGIIWFLLVLNRVYVSTNLLPVPDRYTIWLYSHHVDATLVTPLSSFSPAFPLLPLGSRGNAAPPTCSG
jgi:hypothetical protein